MAPLEPASLRSISASSTVARPVVRKVARTAVDGIGPVEEIVGQHGHEGRACQIVTGPEQRIAQTTGVILGHELQLQRALDNSGPTASSMGLCGIGDDDGAEQSGIGRLIEGPVEHRLESDREHLLGKPAGDRMEPGAESPARNHRRVDHHGRTGVTTSGGAEDGPEYLVRSRLGGSSVSEASPGPKGEQGPRRWTAADLLSFLRIPLAAAFVLVSDTGWRLAIVAAAAATDLLRRAARPAGGQLGLRSGARSHRRQGVHGGSRRRGGVLRPAGPVRDRGRAPAGHRRDGGICRHLLLRASRGPFRHAGAARRSPWRRSSPWWPFCWTRPISGPSPGPPRSSPSSPSGTTCGWLRGPSAEWGDDAGDQAGIAHLAGGPAFRGRRAGRSRHRDRRRQRRPLRGRCSRCFSPPPRAVGRTWRSSWQKMRVQLRELRIDVAGSAAGRGAPALRRHSLRLPPRPERGSTRPRPTGPSSLSLEKYCSVIHSLAPDIAITYALTLALSWRWRRVALAWGHAVAGAAGSGDRGAGAGDRLRSGTRRWRACTAGFGTSARTRVSARAGQACPRESAAVRGELLGHFLLSPGQAGGAGLYFAGGVAVVGGPVDRGYLVLTVGLEERPARGVRLDGGGGGRRWSAAGAGVPLAVVSAAAALP